MMQKKELSKKETKNPWNTLLDSYNFHCCFALSQCTVMQWLLLINQTSEISPRVLEEKVAQLKSAAIEDLKEREKEKRKLLERNDQVRDFRSRWERELYLFKFRNIFVTILNWISLYRKISLLERYCGGLSGNQHKTGQKVLFQSSFFSKRYYVNLQSAVARNQCGIMWKSTSFVQIRGGKNDILLCLICLPDSSDPSQMTKFIKEVKTCWSRSGRPKKIILERKANWKRKGKDLRRNIRRVLRLAKGTLIHKVGCFSCWWIFLLMF